MSRRHACTPRARGLPQLLRASALAALCALSGAVSQAVVLGPVALQSRAGEALLVEIPVRRLLAKELPGLSVRIGDEAAYAEAQMARPEIASQLQVELVPRGEYLRLRVRSAQPVTESRLDLVLVLRWQAGRAIRAFTLLLDGSGSGVPPVSSTVVSAGDTASGIASAYKGEQVTLEQMLMAMLQSNPDAFIDGNVNRLRAGSVLELPPSATAARIDAGEARELMALQERDFLAQRGAAAETPAKGGGEKKPQAEAPRQPAPKGPAPTAPGDRLTLSKPLEAVQTREKDPKLEQLAKEDAQRIEELQRNIAQLNQTIAELNRSVEALQRQSAQAGSAPSASVPASVPAPVPTSAAAPASAAAPLIDELVRHPAAPWAGAGVMAFLLGVALLRIRQRHRTDTPTAHPSTTDHSLAAHQASDPVPDAQAQGGRAAAVPGLPASVQGLSLELDPLPPVSLPASGGNNEAGELADPMAVKLALAREFHALGSLDAARDLAQEVETLADEPLKSRARHLREQLG